MFSWYKYLIVNLVFPTSVFGVGISFCLRLFLIVAYLYFLSFQKYTNLFSFALCRVYNSIFSGCSLKEALSRSYRGPKYIRNVDMH